MRGGSSGGAGALNLEDNQILQAGNVGSMLRTYQAVIAKSPNIALYHYNEAVCDKRVGKFPEMI
jgi:hypothetical protein